jgi:hypothetical protein
MNSDFSSWPREQEQSFVVYEQRAKESQSKAFTIGIISGVVVFVLALGIYAGVEPDQKDLSKDMNMSNLTKKTKVVPAAEPKTETPAPPKAEAPAPAPAPEAPAGDKK